MHAVVPPMLEGAALFDDVSACEASAAFWWLGQHSFIVKIDKNVILIDPYIAPNPEREVPPLFAPGDAAGCVTLVACTHDHSDHIDPVAIEGLAAKTSVKFLAPRAHADRMRSLGVDGNRLHLVDDGESARIGEVVIHGVKAAHEFFEQTVDGAFPFLGYIFEVGGKVVYHAGDTLWWEGLQQRLRRWSMDVAFVPINGRDADRFKKNCLGNMTYQEAVDLVGGLDVKLAVPAHHDMFAFNSEDPGRFVQYYEAKYPGHATWVGTPTEQVTF